MRRNWRIKPADEQRVSWLADSLDLSPHIARLLLHRGAASVSEASDFLNADIGSLPSPFRMAGMEKAVRLIREAAAGRGKVLIVGDYDVDGLTSTAVLYRVIGEIGADVSCHIPHRINDGYGLKTDVIRRAAESGVKLLITVDCGTTSFEEMKLARRLGLETVVVDHHELLLAGPPPASAFLNPLQPQCGYPSKDLASVGVAFTLARGLLERSGSGWVWDHLDLVALGTVADLSPLVGENRILVRAGLHRLRGTRKPGLRALLSQTKLEAGRLTTEDISFCLAPRLNAMGRMGSAQTSLQLLITEDSEEAGSLVKQMNRENKNRAGLEREAFQRALAKVEREIDFSRDRVIVLEDERWHPGVVGIVATRLTARFHRPTVVIALSGPMCRGSARSIRAFPLVEAFEEVKEHLLEFGGHPGAAGLTIAREQVPHFREALNRVAQEWIDPQMLTPSLEMDAEMPLSELTDGFMRDLEMLAPFGPGNPRPVFVSRDARVPAERKQSPFSVMGVRFTLQDARGRAFDALQPRHEIAEGWNVRQLPLGPVEIVYSPVRRLGSDGLQIELKLCDLKLPNTAAGAGPIGMGTGCPA